MIKTLIKSLLLVFLFAFLISAQEKQNKPGTKIIDNAVAKLQQKVLLTEDQVVEIKSILSRSEEKFYSDVKSEVEGVLDSKQKAKYNIIKDDWWNNLAVSMEAIK